MTPPVVNRNTVYYCNNINTSVVILLLTFCLPTILSLSCGSCQLKTCPVLVECKAGVVKDSCNCCAVCAQANGDVCGGIFDIKGKCGIGLYCSKAVTQGDKINEKLSNTTGICRICQEVKYTGCNLIDGICQCGDSCTDIRFEYSDRQTCQRAAKGVTSHCSKKSCPTNYAELRDCPEDSYRPSKKPSLDGCCLVSQNCTCKTVVCPPPPSCPSGSVVQVVRQADNTPGRCCSTYQCIEESKLSCVVGNTTYQHGEWVVNKCRSCQCMDRVLKCNTTRCHLPACEWMTQVPGQCCRTCMGCVKDGQHYANGETWQTSDSCITCQCVNGQSHCTATACSKKCRNPRKIAGQCCPVCSDDEDTYVQLSTPGYSSMCNDLVECPNNCVNKVMVEINGCTVCLCEDDINMCPGSSECTKICAHGYKKDKEMGCSHCQCNRCPQLNCNLECSHGYAKDASGCSLCQCQEAAVSKDSVCFTGEGLSYKSGDSWFDGCRECFCENGREMCSLISCPSLSCVQPIIKQGDCCPSCPQAPTITDALNVSVSCSAADGSQHKDNELWQFDSCTVCLCHEGRALCEVERCPPTLCSHPIKKPGKCCSECTDELNTSLLPSTGTDTSTDTKSCTTSHGSSFEHGDIWKTGDCQSCICKNGSITCFSQVCPSLYCKATVSKKGQCCPLCAADHIYDKVCIYNNKYYKHLETWTDNSLQCTCHHGNVECLTTNCEKCDNNDDNEPTNDNSSNSISLAVGLPIIITTSILLLVFAVIITLLSIVILRHKRTQKTQLTAIPKILEHRNIHKACEPFTKKRPKSTNLEFLHATNDNRYNNAISRGDVDCFRPLMDHSVHGNDYIHC